MLPLLAETAPDLLKPWLEVFFWLGGGVGALLGAAVAVKSLRASEAAPTPQPLVVQAHKSYTPWEQHLDLKARVDKMSDEIRQGFERLDHKRSQSIAGLHDDLQNSSATIRAEVKEDISGVHTRINEVLEAVSELKGRITEGFRK